MVPDKPPRSLSEAARSYAQRVRTTLIALLLTLGCSCSALGHDDEYCSTRTCNKVLSAPRTFVQTSSTIIITGKPAALVEPPQDSTARVAPGTCSARLLAAETDLDSRDAAQGSQLQQILQIRCVTVDGHALAIDAGLGDLRARDPSLGWATFSGRVEGEATGTWCAIASHAVKIDVLASTGDSAPLPQVVTPDFHRDLTLHLGPASECVDFAATLDLDLTATDYTGQTTCQICAL